jgi:hypothetical protein
MTVATLCQQLLPLTPLGERPVGRDRAMGEAAFTSVRGT